jgi:integrase/recombinase XerD
VNGVIIVGKPKSRVCNAIVPGPLEQYAPGFRSWLLARGYTPLTTVPQLQLMAHVSRWLEREGLTAAGLTGQQAGRFLAARHAAGSRRPGKPAGLRPLLGYLGGLGVLPPEPPGPPLDAASVLIAEFAEYLRSERGLAPMTVGAYSSRAARFLARYAPCGDPGLIAPGDVTAAVLAEASGLSAGAGQHLACALRAFLRYCHVRGLVAADVSAAALAVTGRRTTMLPRGLEPGQVAALLAACDRDEPAGRRDYAVIVLLARLGLRAGEAARLRLDDISWRAAEIGIRGKGGQYDVLPLPADAGAAVAAWLRDGRPAVPFREVFTTVSAPTRPLTREAVALIVRRACARAGLEPFGPHWFRHSAATRWLRDGVSIEVVSKLLGHSSVTTTSATYGHLTAEDARAALEKAGWFAGREISW